jgi:hypothetical protein
MCEPSLYLYSALVPLLHRLICRQSIGCILIKQDYQALQIKLRRFKTIEHFIKTTRKEVIGYKETTS